MFMSWKSAVHVRCKQSQGCAESFATYTGTTVDQFKKDAAASCKLRSDAVLPTDNQIQQTANDCVQYVDLLQDTMPHKWVLASSFGWVQTNMFALA